MEKGASQKDATKSFFLEVFIIEIDFITFEIAADGRCKYLSGKPISKREKFKPSKCLIFIFNDASDRFISKCKKKFQTGSE